MLYHRSCVVDIPYDALIVELFINNIRIKGIRIQFSIPNVKEKYLKPLK